MSAPQGPEDAPSEGAKDAPPVYTYGTAGIGEREGRVPNWLWVVVVGLSVWGIYYLIRYWNAPGA